MCVLAAVVSVLPPLPRRGNRSLIGVVFTTPEPYCVGSLGIGCVPLYSDHLLFPRVSYLRPRPSQGFWRKCHERVQF